MTAMEVVAAREAIAGLPEGTSYGEPPGAAQVYLPRSHLRAMHPDNLLVTGCAGLERPSGGARFRRRPCAIWSAGSPTLRRPGC